MAACGEGSSPGASLPSWSWSCSHQQGNPASCWAWNAPVGAAGCCFLIFPRHCRGDCKPWDSAACSSRRRALGASIVLADEPDTTGDEAACPSPGPGQQAWGLGSPADPDWQQAASPACQVPCIIQVKYSFKTV